MFSLWCVRNPCIVFSGACCHTAHLSCESHGREGAGIAALLGACRVGVSLGRIDVQAVL